MDKEVQRSIKKYRKYTFILSTVGFVLAYYSVFVSTSKTQDPNYRALCDISESMRCSTVFTSPYGRGLGIVNKIVGDDSQFYQPNGVYGMLMYSLFVFLSLFPYQFFAKIQVLVGIAANCASLYLAYVLFFIIRDICVICITTYLIGFILMIIAMKNLSAVKRLQAESSTPNYSSYLDGKATGKKRV